MTVRLGFGCAPILGRIGRKASLRALALAYEQGITHFDVARSYGFGEAEQLLGEFLAGKRGGVTVTSKFGVVPPRNTRVLSFAKSVARASLAKLPAGQRVLRACSRAALAGHRYDVPYAQACLEHSLLQLRTDHIDYYLIHDPADAFVVSDELLAFLERARTQGKIGQWGVTGDAPDILRAPGASHAAIFQREANLTRIDQLALEPMDMQGAPGLRTRFLTRPYAGAPAALAAFAARDAVRDAARALGFCHLRPHELSMFFAFSLAGPSGAVIASMFSPRHLVENVQLWQAYQRAGLRGEALAGAILQREAPSVAPAGALP